MKKALLALAAVLTMLALAYGAGTTVNGTRVINGDLTVKGTCTGCGGGTVVCATGISNNFGCLVESHSGSASSYNFTTCISNTYDDYNIEVEEVVPDTNTASIDFLVSFDGGMTYQTSGYLSTSHIIRLNSGTAADLNSASAYELMNSFGTGVTRAMVSGSTKLHSPGNSSLNKSFGGLFILTSSDGNWYQAQAAAVINSASAVNAFQMKPGSGTFSSGIVRCYGIAKS